MTMTMSLGKGIAEQYVDAHNQSDLAALVAEVSALWTSDAEHLGEFAATGRDAIFRGMTKIRTEKVEPAGITFRLQPAVLSRDEVLVFLWDAVSEQDNIVGRGATVAVTTPSGCISADRAYTFADDDPVQRPAQELAERYVDAWNEPDSQARAGIIRGLWASTGVHIGGFVGAGYEELTEGINESHLRHVVGNHLRFRARRHAARKGDTVFFIWDVEPADRRGSPVAAGAQVLQLDSDNKIRKDFTLMMPGAD